MINSHMASDVANLIKTKLAGAQIRFLASNKTTVLATMTLASPAFGTITDPSGTYVTMTSSAIPTGTVTTTGTAAFADLYIPGIGDYSGYLSTAVGLVGSGQGMEITNTSLYSGDFVVVDSLSIRINYDTQ